ncbi:MAG: hypothetical protein K0R53_1900 [Burkholderiales bacterium]|jgi:hypothetical protein|nr:hypothetical protein [Burkholderiales bacterium]
MVFEEIDKYIAENSGVWEKQTRDILLAMPEGLPNCGLQSRFLCH